MCGVAGNTIQTELNTALVHHRAERLTVTVSDSDDVCVGLYLPSLFRSLGTR